MKIKNKYLKLNKIIILFCFLIGFNVHAQPVIAEGNVPNNSSKQAILAKLYSIYGQENVIDRIQIRQVVAPTDWSNIVTDVINEDLKKVKHGMLTIKGSDIQLTGKVSNSYEIQDTTEKFKGLTPENYRLNAQLSVNQAEQKIIDAALKNRIIEFESGSAILATSGIQILDEMVSALNKVSGKKIRIIGHTDSSGDTNKNLMLSQQRAEAVKAYLIAKNIPSHLLSTEGLGSSKPMAENRTAEGRKKNRRLEFEVLYHLSCLSSSYKYMVNDLYEYINSISYNVATIMLFALHIATNKKPIGKSLQWAFYLSMLRGS